MFPHSKGVQAFHLALGIPEQVVGLNRAVIMIQGKF